MTMSETITKTAKTTKSEQLLSSAPMAGYVRHFGLNFGVFLKCVILAIFHLSHAIIPIKLTSHRWWGLWKESGYDNKK